MLLKRFAKVRASKTGEAFAKNLKTAVAGLKMAHMTKITLPFDFLSAQPDGARV